MSNDRFLKARTAKATTDFVQGVNDDVKPINQTETIKTKNSKGVTVEPNHLSAKERSRSKHGRNLTNYLFVEELEAIEQAVEKLGEPSMSNFVRQVLLDKCKEVLGETAVVQEDLSNVVDIGKTIIDSDNVDNYVKKLVNHIGKVVFVNRLYTGGVPSVLMDVWEYGSILEKISADLPEATINETWALEDKKDYSPDVFYKPSVSAKFFNSKVTFEIPMSFTEIQVKESFSSKEQLNGFISMLTTSIENSMTVKLDALIMRTINNMTAETLVAELNTADEGKPVVIDATKRESASKRN